jgi:hypothetical protein
MRFSISVALLAFSLPLVAHCKTVYIDSSCTSISNWNEYWRDARSSAKRAVERMQSASDTDFAAVFKRIFHTEMGSPEGRYAYS